MVIRSVTVTPPSPTEPVLCRCLQVTETTVVEAISTWDLKTVREVCKFTGAGGGCNSCHFRLKQHLRAVAEQTATKSDQIAAY